MNGREVGDVYLPEHRQVQPIDVAMHNIEIRARLRQRIQQSRICGEGLWPRLLKAKGARNDRNQGRARPGVAAGKQGYVMPERQQLFREP